LKKSGKKIKIGLRNFYPSIPFNPWAIFALWLHQGVPQKNSKTFNNYLFKKKPSVFYI
jgi:hypothetical protein